NVGLGGAIIHGGMPYRGRQGNAGEIGFMLTLPLGTGDYLGRHFDLYKLATRIGSQEQQLPSHQHLAQLLAEDDEGLLGWLDFAAESLAPMIVAAEYLLDPQAIVIGGSWHDLVVAALLSRVEE